MANVVTRVRNKVGPRRLPYIPPNGKFLHTNEEVSIPGVLTTEVFLGKDKRMIDLLRNDMITGAIEMVHDGVGGGDGGSPQNNLFRTIIGDGLTTVFELDCGFPTVLAEVFVFDLISGSPVIGVSVQKRFPTDNFIRLEFNPAPPVNGIEVFIFQA